MADVNYVSPAGMQPKVGWQPDGFLGGMLYADQQRDYKDVLSLSKLSSMYGLDKQRNELQEYGLNSTLRDAQRNEAINKANVGMDMFRPQQEANLGQVLAQTGATQASTRTTNINNRTLGQKNEAEIEATTLKNRETKIRQLQELAQMAAASGGGLEGMTAVQAEASKLGIPPQIYQSMIKNPQQFGQRLMQMDAKLQADIEKARIAARGSVEAAGVRSATENTERSVYNAILAGMTEDNNKKPENQRLSPAQLARAASEAFAARRWAPGQGLTPFQRTEQTKTAEEIVRLRTDLATAVSRGNLARAQQIQSQLTAAEAAAGTATGPVIKLD